MAISTRATSRCARCSGFRPRASLKTCSARWMVSPTSRKPCGSRRCTTLISCPPKRTTEREPERDLHPGEARARFEVVEVHAVAHVLFRRVAERLEIPRPDCALRQGGVDETAPMLAFAHGGVERGEIPAARRLRAERRNLSGARSVAREIGPLMRIGDE